MRAWRTDGRTDIPIVASTGLAATLTPCKKSQCATVSMKQKRLQLNSAQLTSRCQSSTSRLLNRRGPATVNQSVTVSEDYTSVYVCWPKLPTSTSVTTDRGQVATWYLRTTSFKSIHCLTDNQWSCLSTGVISWASSSDEPHCHVLHQLQPPNQTTKRRHAAVCPGNTRQMPAEGQCQNLDSTCRSRQPTVM